VIVVSLNDVSRAFSERFVLHHIQLEMKEGEAVALVGHNGSGKTTLLRIVSTLLAPSSGEVRLFGDSEEELSSPSIRKKIGALFTEGFLYGDLTVRQNLNFYAALHGISPAPRLITEELDRFGMRAFENELVRTLSRGERQRIALIRSTLHSPSLILWDEPTTGLDQRGRQLFIDAAKSKKSKTTILCSTHDLSIVESWVDRTITLAGGRIQ